MNNYYCSFGDYMVKFYGKTFTFDILHKGKNIAKNMGFYNDGKIYKYAEVLHSFVADCHIMHLKGFCLGVVVEIELQLNNYGVKVVTNTPVELCGTTLMNDKCYAMSTEEHNFIRCGYGSVCTSLDNMIFDVENDCGFFINGALGKRFSFNYETSLYEIKTTIQKVADIGVLEDVYANKYKIDYAPINKGVTFKKPPVGWMTWYSVMFDASEKTVLENTKWMAENLKKYGAETIWLDWEWYHKDKTGIREDGCDTFNPDREKYPNGLKYLSDEIRKYGLIPSLWIGYTNDPAENEFVKKHPDAVLVQEPSWCGQYFFDISHPAYLNEFLPKALAQIDEWGYEAVKYDTLPICIHMHEKYHKNMYNPELTTKEAFRGMIAKTREILGNDRYLLSCCGLYDSDVLWACDMFDAARVGNDIFNWKEFVKEGIGQVARYYPLHNVVFYNDPDNVIIREKYNNMEQAKSRTAFVGMLGLPVTLGDNLPELPEERVELLKRCIPVLDIHPMDVSRIDVGDTFVTNLAIETNFLNYNVVSILNCREESVDAEISLAELGIDCKNPLTFEYFSLSVAEIKDGIIKMVLNPCETKVFAIHENRGVPQIISTSRHLSQGAFEMENMCWNDVDKVLKFTVDLVEGDDYTITLNIPRGYKLFEHSGLEICKSEGNIARLSVTAGENTKKTFEIKFKRLVYRL